MKYFIILSFMVLALFAFVDTSQAVPTTFAYEGIVDYAGGYPVGTAFDAFLGEKLRIVYTFESTTPDNNTSANGDYLGAVTSILVTVGKIIYTANKGNIIITNNGFNPDQYLVDIPQGLTGPDVAGIPVIDFDLNFSDNTHTVFTSDALPTVQPDPADFSGASLWLSFDGFKFPERRFGIIAANKATRIAPIPEPCTLLLLGSGLLGLLFGGRKTLSRFSQGWQAI